MCIRPIFKFMGMKGGISSLAPALLLFAVPSFGEEDAEDRFYTQQYRDIDSVIWVCNTWPQQVAFAKKICERVEGYVELQLARTDIECFAIEVNASSFQVARKRMQIRSKEDAVPITVHLHVATVDTSGTRPAHSLLTFQHYYSGAMEDGALEGSFGALPRAGTLILDDAETIGIGNTSYLVDAQTNTLKSSLDKMLARLIRYSK